VIRVHSRRDFIKWASWGCAASVVPFGLASTETNALSVEQISLKLPRWEANRFRVAILSDPHLNEVRQLELAKQAANAAIAENPDVILLPGDFLNHSDPVRIRRLEEFLRIFQGAKCPVLATLGNHDRAVRHVDRIVNCFPSSPVRLLQNEIVDMDGVSIVGLDDALHRKHRPDVINQGKVANSLISVLHEPDYVDDMPSEVKLQISGHSHGGQVCLPTGIPVHIPLGARKYPLGFYPDTKVPLFVSRGVGVTGVPFRMFCRPQLAVLTLNGA
jgi:uncharacterized protein